MSVLSLRILAYFPFNLPVRRGFQEALEKLAAVVYGRHHLMKINLASLVVCVLTSFIAVPANADVLFADDFDSYANGTDASAIPGVTTANIDPGDSFTVSNGVAISGNVLKIAQGTGENSPDIYFNFATPVTKDTLSLTIAFDFARSMDFDPNIWMMFGPQSATGFAKGNVAIRNNGFNLFFGAVADPGFQFTGNNTNIFQNLSVTYSEFTNDGTNITGWTTTLVTSGEGTQNNPSTSWVVTGESIPSIGSFRFQERGTVAGDVFIDNLIITTAIPEPSALVLLGFGTAGTMFFRRRA
jgi:hypothetical protein